LIVDDYIYRRQIGGNDSLNSLEKRRLLALAHRQFFILLRVRFCSVAEVIRLVQILDRAADVAACGY